MPFAAAGAGDAAAAFARDGVALVRRGFADRWLDLLDEAVDRALADPGPLSREYAPEGRGRFFTDHHMSRTSEGFRLFVEESPAAEIAAALLGADRLHLIDEHLLVKEPGTDVPTHWHHDLPYYDISREGFASLWIPLDPVTATSGAMKFAKGSHRWNKVFTPIRIGTGAEAEGADRFDGPAPDIDASPGDYDVETYEMDRGDALFFQAATLHAAEPNRTADTRRRALSLRYASEAARWQPRAYVPSRPDKPDLAPGSVLGDNLYPVVWPRGGAAKRGEV